MGEGVRSKVTTDESKSMNFHRPAFALEVGSTPVMISQLIKPRVFVIGMRFTLFTKHRSKIHVHQVRFTYYNIIMTSEITCRLGPTV